MMASLTVTLFAITVNFYTCTVHVQCIVCKKNPETAIKQGSGEGSSEVDVRQEKCADDVPRRRWY